MKKYSLLLIAMMSTGANAADYWETVLKKTEEARERALKIHLPLEGATKTSSYGLRNHPILQKQKLHRGMDLMAEEGTPFYAAGKGVVLYAEERGDLGNKLFKMFPGAGYITWRFLKTIADSNKTDEEIVGALSLLEPIDSNIDKILSDNADDLLKQECKAMESIIIDTLFAKKQRVSKSFSKESPFHESKLIPGVVSKIEPKGAVSIKISKEILDSVVGKQLLQLISKV